MKNILPCLCSLLLVCPCFAKDKQSNVVLIFADDIGYGANPSHRNPTNFMRNGKRAGPMKGYSSQIVVSDAINCLKTKANPDQPFFLNIWFSEPHSKLAAPDEITSLAKK